MFKTFMKQHNKTYKNKAEFKKRFKIFHQNMKKAHILQQNERGTAKYGPTKFADLTGEWVVNVCPDVSRVDDANKLIIIWKVLHN